MTRTSRGRVTPGEGGGEDHRASADGWLATNVRVWDELGRRRVRSTVPTDDVLVSRRGGGRCLDYGCGDGRVARQMAELGWAVDAVDTSPSALALARRQPVDGIAVTPVPTSPLGEDLPGGAHDVVIAVAVLSSVPSADHRRQLATRLGRARAAGGRLIVADFVVTGTDRYREIYERPVLEEHSYVTSDGILIHHFSVDELVDLVDPDGGATVTRGACLTIHGHQIDVAVVSSGPR